MQKQFHSTKFFSLVLSVCLVLGGLAGNVLAASRGDSKVWKAAVDASWAARSKENMVEAEQEIKTALAEAEKFGPKDSKLPETLGYLGTLYAEIGQFGRAEEILRRRLEITQQQHSRSHIDVAYAQRELADACLPQKKYAEAEQLALLSQKTIELKFGKSSPQESRPLLSLGRACIGQKKFAEAEAVLKRALDQAEHSQSTTSYKPTLGPGTPADTIVKTIVMVNFGIVTDILYHLTWLYKLEGKYDEAEAIYRKTISTAEERFSKDYPEVKKLHQAELKSLYDNFEVFNKQLQQYRETEINLRRALEVQELATDQRFLFQAITSITALSEQAAQKNYKEASESLEWLVEFINKNHNPKLAEPAALALLADALAKLESGKWIRQLLLDILLIKQETLDKDSPALAPFLQISGEFYYKQAAFAEAEPLLARALALQNKTPGTGDASLLPLLEMLALVNQSLIRHDVEQAMWQWMLRIQEKQYGTNHTNVIQTLDKLLPHYRRKGQKTELDIACQRILAIKEKALGPEHVELTNPLNLLADLRLEQGKEAEALILLRRSLAIDVKARGADNLVLGATVAKLIALYTKQGNDAELEPLLKQELLIFEKTFGTEDAALTRTLENYVQLLRRTKRDAEAATVEERLKKIRAKTQQ